MRFNIKKSDITGAFATSLMLALFVFSAQAFASDKADRHGVIVDNQSQNVIQIAKGQRYKPPRDIYREQC